MTHSADVEAQDSRRDGFGRIGGALSWSVLGKAVRGILLFLITVYVIRRLGKVEFGHLTIARTILGFFTVLCWMGLTQALLRYLPEFRVSGNAMGARRLIAITLAVQTVLWAALFGATFVLRAPLERFYHAPVGPLVSLGAGLLLIDLFVSTWSNVLTSWYKIRDLTAAQSAGSLAYLLIGWLAVRQGYGPAGVLVAAALANLGIGIYLMIDSRQFALLSSRGGEGVRLREVMLYSMPFAATSLLNLIIWNPSEILIVGHYMSAAQVSFYERAYTIPQQFLDFVPAAIWPLMFASFSEVFARDRSALPRAVNAYYKLLFFLAAPIAVWGALVAPRAIPGILGADWAAGGTLCSIFFLMFSATYVSTPLSLCLYVLGKSWINLLINVFNAGLIVLLNFVLIPRYGILGAVVPVGIVIAVSPFFYHAVVRRLAPEVRVPWVFILRCYLATLPLVALAALTWSVRRWYGLLGISVLAGVVTLASARVFRLLGDEERAVLDKLRVPMKSVWMRVLFAGAPA